MIENVKMINNDEINAEIEQLKQISKPISPIYKLKKVKVWEVCNQDINPNILNKNTFFSLCLSIARYGITQCPCAYINNNYVGDDKVIPMWDRLNLCLQGNEEILKSGCFSGEFNFANSLQGNDRNQFKYHLVDGTQRTSIIRMGTHYYFSLYKHCSKNWAKGINIPQKPGRMMLAYIAWREEFSVPIAILDQITDENIKALTILSNDARGHHDFKTTRAIVTNLTESQGVDWVHSNLYMEKQKIRRMSGIDTLQNRNEDISDVWCPETDPRYAELELMYKCKEAVERFNEKSAIEVFDVLKKHGYKNIHDAFYAFDDVRDFFRMFDINVDEIDKLVKATKPNWDVNLKNFRDIIYRRMQYGH